MRLGKWNVRAYALCLVTSEMETYRMNLEGVLEFRWEDSNTVESINYTLFL